MGGRESGRCFQPVVPRGQIRMGPTFTADPIRFSYASVVRLTLRLHLNKVVLLAHSVSEFENLTL